MEPARFRPSPALVVASIALFVALAGTGVAAVTLIGPNTVASPQVVNGSLQAADLNASLRSDAFSRSVAGPVTFAGTSTTLATLAIPQAGRYLIWAKAYFRSTKADNVVRCVLSPDGNVEAGDVSWTSLLLGQVSVSNHLVNTFKSAGTATFECVGVSELRASDVKVTALKVASLKST